MWKTEEDVEQAFAEIGEMYARRHEENRRCLFCTRRMPTPGFELEARNYEVDGHPGVHPFLGDVHKACYYRALEGVS